MSTRTFLSLVPRLQISAPGCPQPVLMQYVRSAAILACERSLAWTHELAPQTLTAGQSRHSYVLPVGAEVHTVLSATNNSRPMCALPMQDLSRLLVRVVPQGAPVLLAHWNADQFAVWPVPNALVPYVVRMVVVLKPLRTAIEMDQTTFDELEDAILHCALRDLLVLPDKPWSDRELAVFHARQFSLRVTDRQARARIGAAGAAPHVQMSPLA